MRVQVYYNVHKKCWSVRDKETRKVIAHSKTVKLRDCKFHVSDAGRERVRQEERKNVHAWVEGEWLDGKLLPEDYETSWIPVTYDPYKYESFVRVKSEEPINTALDVLMHNKRVWALETFS